MCSTFLLLQNILVRARDKKAPANNVGYATCKKLIILEDELIVLN